MGHTASYSARIEIHQADGNSRGLLRVSNDIYYENGDDEEDEEDGSINDSSSTFIVTKEFIDSLKPGDKIILSGTGSCF